jgi:hypothetical protein
MKDTELGMILISAGMVNSWFQMMNPLLTGLFYIGSIVWLAVQIYFKIKNRKK